MGTGSAPQCMLLKTKQIKTLRGRRALCYAMVIMTHNQTSPLFCQCGRDARKAHCPACGSQSVRATPSKRTQRNVDGAMQEFIAMYCRVCGNSFDTYDWHFECKAPPLSISRPKKPAYQTEASIQPEEVSKAVAEIKASREAGFDSVEAYRRHNSQQRQMTTIEQFLNRGREKQVKNTE